MQAFSKSPEFYRIHRNFQAFQAGFRLGNADRSSETHVAYMIDWVRQSKFSALKSSLSVSPRDAAALIETAKECDETTIDES